jgi:hypothetical protein
MSNASKVVTAWIGGILNGTFDSAAHHLSPKLDWRENGLSYEKASKKHPRPKWKGLKHPGAMKSLTATSNGEPPTVIEFEGYRLKRTEVCSDEKSAVFEFAVGPKGKEQKFCGVFHVKGDQITSAHFYGDASAFVAMGNAGTQA